METVIRIVDRVLTLLRLPHADAEEAVRRWRQLVATLRGYL